MIDRQQLRYFLAVIDQGNFSRAAAACHVSQPTLSVSIAKLERDVGTQLFIRTNRRTEVTQAGAQLAEHARRIESEFLSAEQFARVATTTPATLIRLGAVNTIPLAIVRAAAERYRARSPGARLELIFDGESRLQARLDRGRLDAVLGLVRSTRTHRSTPLLTEGYRLAMARTHPLADRQSIDPGELAENPMIVRRHCEVLAETSRHFTAYGVRPFIAARTTSDDQALACIAAGMGVSVMPESYAGPEIAMPMLTGFDPVRTIGLIYAREPQAPSVVHHLDTFGDMFRETVDTITPSAAAF